MYIGRVKGNVVSTIKHSLYEGRKLMLVARLNLDGSEAEAYDICLDDVQAGVGDVVVVLDEGSSARQVIGKRGTGPARAIIVGIVDTVELRNSPPQPASKKRSASGRRRAQAGS